MIFALFLRGAINAVKAAATTKKINRPTKIHDIPLSRRFFFGVPEGRMGAETSVAV